MANYNPLLVILSFVMSILASWVALDLSARVHLKTRRSRKAFWLALGSGAMGLGIWSMHYIGMLAFRMQVPVLYDWPTVVLSLVVALAASAIALILVARKTLSWSNTVLGGTVMGAAIASMHYLGMSAMRMSMGLNYSKPMVALSVALAVGISMVALRLTFGSKKLTFGWSGKKASSAFLMGLAIPTMHYTGMAAVHMTDSPGRFSAIDLRHAISTTEVGTTAIILISLLVLGVALILARIDGHVSTFQSALDGSKRSYTQLQQHHERLQGAFKAGGFGLWECDPATGVFYVTSALRDLYGIPQDDQPVPRERWKTAVHPDDLATLDQRWAECMASGDKYENEYRILVGPDHQVRRVRSVASLVRNLEGAVTRVLGMTWEVTSERLREEEQRDQATRFRLTLNAIGDAVIATDDQMRVIFINPAASELTGWGIDAAVNSPIEAVLRAEDEQTGAPRPNPIQRCIEHGGSFLAEDAVLISRSGERYNIRKHVVLMGMGRAAVITFQNITAARRLEKQLLYAATHDSLTKLVNRTMFEKRLNGLWEENRYSGRTHCVCIVDLDRFKIINDASGHLAGDALLRELARLMKEGLRQTDLVARMGGDEFMLLLSDTTISEATSLLESLLASVSSLRFPWQGKTYDVTASIGVVSFDCFSPEPEVLLSQADAAAFTAKRNGRNQISTYVDEGHAAKHLFEMEVASDLRRCIEEDCFELHAQPIVAPQSPEDIRYFEVLLRMRGRDGKLVSPALFIPAAERYGMMILVDRWVIRNTLKIYQKSGATRDSLRLAINLSASSLSDLSLWQFVSEQFLLTSVNPACITFEVTETAIIDNLNAAKTFMTNARSAGCHIALDDFGTGLSSLSYLKQFPLDVIKIDGGFVGTLVSNSLDQEIVRAIGQIARSIGATTVAECVENKETIEVCKELKVDWIQGWATGRPEPLTKILAIPEQMIDPTVKERADFLRPFLLHQGVA